MNYEDVIQKTKRRLLAGVREQTANLTETYVANSEVLQIGGEYSGAIQPGTRLAIDLEIFYVTSTTTAGAIGVVPGYEGSTPANHNVGSLIFINPRFSYFDIGVAVNDDLLDLSAPDNGLGQIINIAATYNPTFQGYDLGSQFVSPGSKILEVNYQIAPPVRTNPQIRKGTFRVLRNANQPTVFPSGNGLIIYESAYPGLPINIQALSPFNPLVNLTDDLTTVAGLPPSMYDLPDLGAALRLMDPREVKRNFYESQPDPRKAVEIPPQAVANSSAKLEGRAARCASPRRPAGSRWTTRWRGRSDMSMEVCFTDPWLDDVAEANPQVPQFMEVTIAGRAYVMDTSFEPYRRDAFRHRSIQAQRESISLDNIPGEGTVNTEGLWRREADDWHFGAGQPYQDRKDSVDGRFSTSKGVNPWMQWQLSLLNDTTQVVPVSGSAEVVQCGQYIYVLDLAANTLKFTANLSTWTTVSINASNLSAVATDGYNLWIASDGVGGPGIFTTTAGSTTTTPYVTEQPFDGVYYVGDRLMATWANNVYNITHRRAVRSTSARSPRRFSLWRR